MEFPFEFAVVGAESNTAVERAKRPVPMWKRSLRAAGGVTLIAFAVFMATVANTLYPFFPAQKPPREGELVFCGGGVEMPEPFEGRSPYKAWTFWFPRWSIEADNE
ncbi:MAG TPA: hypothetical protein VHB77_13965 [Planctomycetaceae bacterium]|nr:hypothetical protein [Planctomycetaceae bacterium]